MSRKKNSTAILLAVLDCSEVNSKIKRMFREKSLSLPFENE